MIAQRLVRRYCGECKGAGCDLCGGVGFYGRLAIAEIMPMNEEIRDLVLERKTGSSIRKAAIRNQMASLYEDGMAKVRKGLTSKEEIERIVWP